MKQIIALGGGGFSMEPEHPFLDDYILQQADTPNPKICFLPTASGDSAGYIERFYNAFESKPCTSSHLSLFKPPTRDLRSFILEKDVVYVGGGNTVNMLLLWKHWGLDKILEEAYEQGTILTGLSAGSICWFEEGITDSYGAGLEPISGLGLLSGSHAPHYDGEHERRPTFQRLISETRIQAGIAADDGVGLHYKNGSLAAIIKSRKNAHAHRVEVVHGAVKETRLKSIYLGDV
ncbi:Type 1 glutamine amidotransferase-like domain-containing protein [Shouchella sp. JSM 1781072]|uniref:Type 1 glutamine amidotransferase-like domain-containing protein n=1 Tax=Bacillaceae TaxID=186817 RepID=UPI0020D0E481|nr:peptidase E [Alkalihalobacillus sp. LMS6]UTR05980.1 peptidase E [Alkalihalobacillus sp. LMS6]